MSTNVVVPTDVTVCEAKYSTGVRSLTFAERVGLAGIPPMAHFRYTKMDKNDMRDVLSRELPQSNDPVVDILRRRQAAVHRQVVAHNGLWIGTTSMVLLTCFSFRHYDYKTKMIISPFAAYFGAFAGRFIGNGVTGRWSESGRDRALGELPAKQSLQL